MYLEAHHWGKVPQLIILWVVLLTSIPQVIAGQAIAGKVIGITDGDTLTLLDTNENQIRVRIAGIDTPERGQAYGHVASENLAHLAFGKLAVAECQKQDKYGRWICLIRVDGLDIGLSQIKAGLAWHYKKYASEQSAADQELYARAEQDSIAARAGLWKDAEPIAPWDWRRRK